MTMFPGPAPFPPSSLPTMWVYRRGPGEAECGASAEDGRERPALALLGFRNEIAAAIWFSR